jgi:hypothetical protein
MRHNRAARLFVFTFIACWFPAKLRAQDQRGWPVISPEDLVMKDNQAKPGSSAMILMKRESRDDVKGVWQTFYRIKIFTENGRDYGDIEIPYVPNAFEVDDIFARVIQPDGSSTEFKGPIYEKTLARRQKSRVMAKTFTLPNVGPGVIIDYRYIMKSKSASPPEGPWALQERLFVRRVDIEWRPQTKDGPLEPQWRVLARSLPGGANLIPDEKGVMRATLKDIPAFEEEPFMPPEETVKMRYVLFRTFGSVVDPETYFKNQINDYIGKPGAFSSVVKEMFSAQDSADAKVQKIYKAIQERIRNLSYEEIYTKQERKRESIKERKSAQDVWRLGYGREEEIVFLFVAMCRAAGFTADPIGVIQRDGQFYDAEMPKIQQINGWVAAVDLPAGSKPFDPGVRFAPSGWISWPKEGVPGIRFGIARVAHVELPWGRTDRNRLRRDVTLTLQADGSADVRLVTAYSGEDAVERRNDFFDLPKSERDQLLRKELKEAFPSAEIEEIKWEGMDDESNDANVSYHFRLLHAAQISGSRLVLEPRLFQQRSPFPNWGRKHPVYLRRAIDTQQEFRIVPPPGYQLDQGPEPRDYKLTLRDGTIGTYTATTSQNSGSIVHTTQLSTSVIYIVPQEYPQVKRFYDQVAASERTYVILRKQ